MFCTNCGTKLPDNAKFCPNCGASIVGADPAPQTDVQVIETAEDAVQVIAEAEQTAEEVLTRSTEAVQAVTESGGSETAETDAQDVTVTETPDDMPQTAEAEVPEAVSSPGVPAAVPEETEQAQDISDETADNAETECVPSEETEVQPAIDEPQPVMPEAPVAAEETAAEEEPVTPDQQTVPYTVPAMPPENEQAAAGTDAAASASPFAQPQETPAFNPYVQQEVPQDTAAQTVPQKSGKTEGRKKGKGLIAALLAVVVLAGAFLAYWNLPGTKAGRYLKQAVSAQESGDYVNAADLYHKVLELLPEDQQSNDALVSMYEEVEYESVDYVENGQYELALEGVRLMYAILPENEENNEYALYDVYYNWATNEAQKGNFDTVETILDRVDAELSTTYADDINNAVANMRETVTLQGELSRAATDILGYNESKDYKAVFEALVDEADCLRRYVALGNELPFFVLDTDDFGVGFYYDSSRDSAQVYIGGILSGSAESGAADTYYIGNLNGTREYEYFYAENWFGGRPSGQFTEITFNGEPDIPYDSNSSTVTGTLKNGKYDGEIVNNRNGKVYYMMFDYGTVQVLDTVDPNGDSGNVVGYTADKNGWITFRESGLTKSYGVRYLT